MKRTSLTDLKEYYKTPICIKCKALMTNKEIKKRKDKGFLKVCDLCYIPLERSLKACLPLMQKLHL
jgi:hypothetical protein